MDNIKQFVKENYAKIAKGKTSSCCCGSKSAEIIGKKIGYNDKELSSVPEGANLGLGCGNPTALAAIQEGQTVLDLGSGAGFDCFLASKQVGPTGRVIGVDMTPDMIAKARENARKANYTNVEFIQGEIEQLPLEDQSVDIVISNCVINLSPDKESVFKEAYRVLKPGGQLMVSDLVLSKPLPDVIAKSVAAYSSCIAGAIPKNDYSTLVKKAGFKDVKIVGESEFPLESWATDPFAEGIINKLEITPEVVREFAKTNTISSIKLAATK